MPIEMEFFDSSSGGFVAAKKPTPKRKARGTRKTATMTTSYGSIVKSNPVFEYPPSEYQMGVFNFLSNDEGSAFVNARAGAGKTSTMEMIGRNLNQTVGSKRQFVLMLAFNKSIAEELSSRMPKWIKCSTFHSVAYGTWMRHVKGRVQIDKDKVRKILKEIMSEKDFRSMSGVACRLIGLAKNAGIGTWLTEDIDENWSRLIMHHCLDIGTGDDEDGDRKMNLIRHCRRALSENNRMRTVIDFDDMLYLPILENAYFFRNHLLMVDEAQDTNIIQIACLQRMLRREGRMVAVGDPNQAIYGFRGADARAVDKLIKWFKCKVLPLSICYRCDKAIVREAQTIVPEIEPYEKNGEGVVETVLDYDTSTFKSGDAILCRNTSPLIRFAYSLIKRKVPARVKGREIGKGLVTLIKTLKSSTIGELAEDLNGWADKQITRLAKEEGGEAQVGVVNDKVECIKIFMENLDHRDHTIDGLCKSILSLFSDDAGPGVTLCTVHRSKGHEFDRVFILDSHLMPSGYARLEWQRQQEFNLMYVAITRAKHYLGYINSQCWKD